MASLHLDELVAIANSGSGRGLSNGGWRAPWLSRQVPIPSWSLGVSVLLCSLQETLPRQHSSSGGAAAGEVLVPGLGDSQQRQADKDAADAASPAAADANGAAAPQSFQLAVARNADQAWAQVQGLQERAKLQVQAAAAAAATAPASDSGGPHPPGPGSSSAAAGQGSGGGAGQQQGAEAALDPLLAQLLAKASSLQGCWGKAMFGFHEVEVLQLMEALPKADQTTIYQFVDQRGGWEKEQEFLAKGRWARRSMLQAGAKKVPSKKQQQGRSSPAAGGGGGDGAGVGKAAGSGTPSKKRPHPASAAAAAAAANAGAPSALFGTAAPKRYRQVLWGCAACWSSLQHWRSASVTPRPGVLNYARACFPCTNPPRHPTPLARCVSCLQVHFKGGLAGC
jgi:hypothetical protein